MPSSWSASLRFELQFTGENINTWGERLNTALTRADDAIAGWLNKPLTGDYVLTTANGDADEARVAMIKFTGAGPFTVTIPSVSKRYDIWNACSGVVTITTGAGATVAVQPGEAVAVISDGADVTRSQGSYFAGRRITGLADPVGGQDAATKAYADALAFTANAGILPGQGPGTNGWALFSNGSNALWKQVVSTDFADFNTAVLGVQVALAVAL